MAHLAPLDWFWIIAFLVLMIGCGVLFYKLGKRSEADFFLAGRGLPWWLPAASIFATHTATDTPMWITGTIYEHGMRGIWYVSLFPAWCAISAMITTRVFRRSLAYTMAEWQTLRYGGLGSELMRGWMAGWGMFLNMFVLGWVGMAMGKVCNMAFGWPPWMGLIVFSSVCYWGVVMTDFQQGVIAFGAIVITSVWGIVAAGGPSAIVHRLNEMGEGWRLDPFAFSGFWSGEFPVAWFLTMFFFAVAGGIGMGTTIDWYAEAQRIQSARSVRDASYSIWAGSALVLVRNALWVVSALAFYVLYPAIKDRKDYEIGWFRMGFEY
ncbi:MAG: sodium:solute symporter, partial [Acidobacteria bacterium]|nr:sodium:solute symporter [Acidobacteriota bacterium]